jgi:hypothetical protein
LSLLLYSHNREESDMNNGPPCDPMRTFKDKHAHLGQMDTRDMSKER